MVDPRMLAVLFGVVGLVRATPPTDFRFSNTHGDGMVLQVPGMIWGCVQHAIDCPCTAVKSSGTHTAQCPRTIVPPLTPTDDLHRQLTHWTSIPEPLQVGHSRPDCRHQHLCAIHRRRAPPPDQGVVGWRVATACACPHRVQGADRVHNHGRVGRADDCSH
jgi:hypothetical protein